METKIQKLARENKTCLGCIRAGELHNEFCGAVVFKAKKLESYTQRKVNPLEKL